MIAAIAQFLPFLLAVGGVVVLAKVWDKIRRVIVANSGEGGEYHFGISHSGKRKNMSPLTQAGIEGLEVEAKTCYGLCNKPPKTLAQIGTVTEEKGQELIDSLPQKKRDRVEKRRKPAG